MNNPTHKFRIDGKGPNSDQYYKSSNIKLVHFTAKEQLSVKMKSKYPRGKLLVVFQDGGRYTYNVDEDAFWALERRAREEHDGMSTGQYYNSGRFVKDHVDPQEASKEDGAYINCRR